MSSGGKWPTKWLSARAKTTDEHEPGLREYLGLEDDGPDQPPPVPLAAHAAPAPSPAPAPAPSPAPAPGPAGVRPKPPAPVPAAPPVPPRTMVPDVQPAKASAARPPETPRWSRMRAVIGDELRAPALLCEFGFHGCTAWYTHPDALGERQLRDLALAAGWQYDLIGRLACPSCVRHAPTFWSRRQQSLPSREGGASFAYGAGT